MDEKQISPRKKGNIIIENRQNMSVSGITDVESFDTDKIVLLTPDGALTVTGTDMRVKKLSAENGEAFIEGGISGCMYTDGRHEKEGFLRRVLK